MEVLLASAQLTPLSNQIVIIKFFSIFNIYVNSFLFVEPLEDFTRVEKPFSGMLRNMQAVQKNGVDGTSRIKVFECQKRNIEGGRQYSENQTNRTPLDCWYPEVRCVSISKRYKLRYLTFSSHSQTFHKSSVLSSGSMYSFL